MAGDWSNRELRPGLWKVMLLVHQQWELAAQETLQKCYRGYKERSVWLIAEPTGRAVVLGGNRDFR